MILNVRERESLRNDILHHIIPRAIHEADKDKNTDIMKYVATYVTEFIADNFEKKPTINESLGILGE